MCGRYALLTPPERLAAVFGLTEIPEVFGARYNVAPSQRIAVVREEGSGASRKRKLVMLRWGLVPAGALSATRLREGVPAPINARVETAGSRPAFRMAARYRRAIVPADGFYEWKAGEGGKKRAMFVRLKGERTMGLAALWERWTGPGGGEETLESVVILTTAPNGLLAPIHDRMPGILAERDWGAWLDPEQTDAGAALSLVGPYPGEEMEVTAVGRAVNSVRNDGPECLMPGGEEEDGAGGTLWG